MTIIPCIWTSEQIRTVLPQSFLRGDRYMRQLLFNMIAIVGRLGTPVCFWTSTANRVWPEISNNLDISQSPSHRPVSISRLFRLHLKSLLADLEAGVLGNHVANGYIIEYQKKSDVCTYVCTLSPRAFFCCQCRIISYRRILLPCIRLWYSTDDFYILNTSDIFEASPGFCWSLALRRFHVFILSALSQTDYRQSHKPSWRGNSFKPLLLTVEALWLNWSLWYIASTLPFRREWLFAAQSSGADTPWDMYVHTFRADKHRACWLCCSFLVLFLRPRSQSRRGIIWIWKKSILPSPLFSLLDLINLILMRARGGAFSFKPPHYCSFPVSSCLLTTTMSALKAAFRLNLPRPFHPWLDAIERNLTTGTSDYKNPKQLGV